MIWLGQDATIDRDVVGGKAASINLMMSMGLPVPPAFTLPTTMSRTSAASEAALSADVEASLVQGLRRLEGVSGQVLGDPERPLLVSVRSGAATSMPGMMDTILNLGVTPEVEAGISRRTRSTAFAADLRRRFVEQFTEVVGRAPTDDPLEDLRGATRAVFASWWSERATTYRRHHGLSDTGGTSVTVQAMVLGNVSDDSGTGVLFTRNPMTGEPQVFGEWLARGQGEDVVSGRHDAHPLDALREELPDVHAQLLAGATQLEAAGRDMQDIEFTVQEGQLYFLQARAGKRSASAAVRIAVDLVEEGVLSPAEAAARVTPEQVRAAGRPQLDPTAVRRAPEVARGTAASPGVAVGRVVSSSEAAEALASDGGSPVLVRPTTDPRDVGGMVASVAIVTEVGGATSHAAVVSRELDTPCVVGCGVGALAGLDDVEITVDGTHGIVYRGAVPVLDVPEGAGSAVARIRSWKSGDELPKPSK